MAFLGLVRTHLQWLLLDGDVRLALGAKLAIDVGKCNQGGPRNHILDDWNCL